MNGFTKALVVMMVALMLVGTASATTIDINSALINSVDCVSGGNNNISVNIVTIPNGATAGFGAFNARVGSKTTDIWSAALTVTDDGNGTVAGTVVTTDAKGYANFRVTIPSTLALGSVDLNINSTDGNSANDANNVFTVYVLPSLVKITEFSKMSAKAGGINNTDKTDANTLLCGIVDLTAVTNVIVETSVGNKIDFKNQTFDLNKSKVLDFDSNIDFTDTTLEAFENAGLITSGNAASVTFGNLVNSSITKPEVWYAETSGKISMICPGNICSNLTYTDGTASFDVSGFSYYELKDGSSGLGLKQQALGQIPTQGIQQAAGQVLSIAGTINLGGYSIPMLPLGILVLVALVYVGFFWKR